MFKGLSGARGLPDNPANSPDMGGSPMRSIFRAPSVALFGLLSWAIPFVAAFAFFGPGGKLMVPQPLFKSAMVVIGGTVGVALLVLVFRRIAPTRANGLIVGLYWLVINLVLDFLVLLPMSGMGAGDYLMDIGLRYLLLPVIAVGMGMVGERAGR
jgi:hypothetical protein